jgi:GAF domain-containing protein
MSVNEFEDVYRTDGVRAALSHLLVQSNFRFIGIWGSQQGRSKALVHVDREQPQQVSTATVGDHETYCRFVRDSHGPVLIADSTADERCAAHPAKSTVLSYVGVPLLTPEGEVLGTLCYYDLVPRDSTEIDVELLLNVATFIVQNNAIPTWDGATTAPTW